MKKLFGFALSLLLLSLVSTTAFADGVSSCQIVYGGGQVCQNQIKFTINKEVQLPGNGNYVENLSVNDPHYAPSQSVNFKIVITNTGSTDITNLNVVDTFPQFLTFLAGVGNTNVGSSQINFVIGKISAGQTLEYVVTAKTADAGSLPANQSLTCVTNNVTATAQDGTQANDNSQMCIANNVPGTTTTTGTTSNSTSNGSTNPGPQILVKPTVTTIPSTGPETDILFGLVSSGALGIFLRKKTN